jgi:hypothetical protein
LGQLVAMRQRISGDDCAIAGAATAVATAPAATAPPALMSVRLSTFVMVFLPVGRDEKVPPGS